MEMVTADKGDKGDKGTSYLLECMDMGMKEVHWSALHTFDLHNKDREMQVFNDIYCTLRRDNSSEKER